MKPDRQALGVLAAAATMLVGGGAGAAAAGSGDGDRSARCEALLAKIAERRGVSVEQLETAVKARLLARIAAAEEAGRLSSARAAKLRQRVMAASPCGERPAAKDRVKAALATGGMLKAAADFLGLNRTELRAQLPGTSLAALAQKQGESVAALEAAMVAPARQRLTKAVADGKVTRARADAALDRLEALAHRLATKVFPTG